MRSVFKSSINSPEVFYLHLSGVQRGPYRIPQIDHLLNSGLIPEETLYWREGLDQWQPVTSLVKLRKKPNRWLKPAILASILLAIAVPVRIFGPVALEGWHEANQHHYDAAAAYWRARDVVRTAERQRGALVEFDAFSATGRELQPPDGAQLILAGTRTAPSGETTSVRWRVIMHFDAGTSEWSGYVTGK